MSTTKTFFNDMSVTDFVNSITNEQQKLDTFEIIKLMEKCTNEDAKMFGTNIIGFGKYHYKYKSGHEGFAPLLSFSPRKNAISLYVFTGLEEHENLIADLGKFTKGKACIYIKKLTDINLDILQNLMMVTILYLTSTYTKV